MADTVSLPENRVGSEPGKDYALSGKIMLCAAVVLFIVVVFMAGLQLYAKWYVVRLRRRRLEHRHLQRRATRSQVITYIDSRLPAVDRGLDPAVLKSLPVFLHAPSSPTVECAVCISELEESETGRALPKCGHAFHTECIDMWFGSHSTCPLCRSPVEAVGGSSSVSNDARESEPGRVLSVKGILSIGRRSAAAGPEGTGEVDLESGPIESDRVRTPS